MQKITVFRGFIALAALSFSLMGHAQDISSNHQFLHVDEDSSVNPPQAYINYKSDGLYNIVLTGGKVTSLNVNGRQIPSDSFFVYNEVIQRVKAQIARDRKQAILDKIQAERDSEQALRDKKQAEDDMQQAGRDREQAVRDKLQADRDQQQAVRDKLQAEKDAQQAMLDKEQAERDRQQAVRDKQQAEEDRILVKSLMPEVVKAGIVPDEKSITSIILDDSDFYVNGKRQPDELQQKFSKKFIKRPGYGIHYHNGRTNVGRMDE